MIAVLLCRKHLLFGGCKPLKLKPGSLFAIKHGQFIAPKVKLQADGNHFYLTLSLRLKSSVPPQEKWSDLTCPRGSASRSKLPWRFFFRHVRDRPGTTTPIHQTLTTPTFPKPQTQANSHRQPMGARRPSPK